MAKAKATANRPPSRNALARFCALREKKRKLDAQLRAIESEMYGVHEACLQYLEDEKLTATKVGRFSLAIVEGPAVVRWKDEFVKVAGAEAAAKLSANAERSGRLQITGP